MKDRQDRHNRDGFRRREDRLRDEATAGTEMNRLPLWNRTRRFSQLYEPVCPMSPADLLTFDSWWRERIRAHAHRPWDHRAYFSRKMPGNSTTLSTQGYREIPTTNHIELYDDENRVNQAVAFANEWLSDQP
jgi:hypothetical protein